MRNGGDELLVGEFIGRPVLNRVDELGKSPQSGPQDRSKHLMGSLNRQMKVIRSSEENPGACTHAEWRWWAPKRIPRSATARRK